MYHFLVRIRGLILLAYHHTNRFVDIAVLHNHYVKWHFPMLLQRQPEDIFMELDSIKHLGVNPDLFNLICLIILQFLEHLFLDFFSTNQSYPFVYHSNGHSN